MSNERQSIVYSVMLHSVAIGILAFFIFVKPLKAEDQPVVLELVSLPEEMPQPPQPEQVTTPEAISIPVVNPTLPRDLPDIKIPEPEPEPVAPTPQPEPVAPKPEPVKPKVETPKPKPEPKVEAPKPKPEPQKPKPIDISKFRQEHGERKPDAPRPTPQRDVPNVGVKAPTAPDIKASPQQPTRSSNTVNPNLLEGYKARLKTAIELNWDKPTAGAGTEWVDVRFRVYSNGSIGEVTILNRNGPEAFVQSVKRAIQSTLPIGPPPPGWDGWTVIRFELK